MSDQTNREISEQDISGFLEKLRVFSDGLNPTEQTVFAGVMRLWAEMGGDVQGYGTDPKLPTWGIDPTAVMAVLTSGSYKPTQGD